MSAMRLLAMAIALLLFPAAAMAKPHPDWLTTVNVTASGSHVMGNPDAEVKLTEFISYTCPHCANFYRQANGPLRLAYVFPGKVSVEVRHFIRDPIDLTITLLTNCGDPHKFFGNHAAFLSSQDKWITVMGTATDGQKQRWTSGEMAARFRAIASDFGFYAIMEERGYGRPEVDRCLADEAKAHKLVEQTTEAQKLGVPGTPGFLLNGLLLTGTYDWASLEPQLKARFE